VFSHIFFSAYIPFKIDSFGNSNTAFLERALFVGRDRATWYGAASYTGRQMAIMVSKARVCRSGMVKLEVALRQVENGGEKCQL
jgi:hypothetical protein